jgi:hypothetical protein
LYSLPKIELYLFGKKDFIQFLRILFLEKYLAPGEFATQKKNKIRKEKKMLSKKIKQSFLDTS